MPGKFGQEDAFLRRGIASANHKDFLAGKEFTVTGGAVGNAPALVFLLTLKTNRSGMGTSGKQDTKTAMFPLISAHSLDIPRKVKADSLCQHKLCTKRFYLLLDGVSQGFAAGFGNTRIVNYLMGDGDLTTELFFFQNQYPVLCPGQIQGGGEPRRTTANHNHIVQIFHQSCPTRSRLGFRVSAPGFQLAGQTWSPWAWTNWQACTLRSSSSAFRPTLPAVTS